MFDGSRLPLPSFDPESDAPPGPAGLIPIGPQGVPISIIKFARVLRGVSPSGIVIGEKNTISIENGLPKRTIEFTTTELECCGKPLRNLWDYFKCGCCGSMIGESCGCGTRCLCCRRRLWTACTIEMGSNGDRICRNCLENPWKLTFSRRASSSPSSSQP
jgi:hypothetical protein